MLKKATTFFLRLIIPVICVAIIAATISFIVVRTKYLYGLTGNSNQLRYMTWGRLFYANAFYYLLVTIFYILLLSLFGTNINSLKKKIYLGVLLSITIQLLSLLAVGKNIFNHPGSLILLLISFSIGGAMIAYIDNKVLKLTGN